MSGAAIGIAALRRISTGRVALVAAAICVATAPSPSFAADWTDANDPTVTYTALKSINGGGSGYIATDIRPTGKDTVKFKFKPDTVVGIECIYCSRYEYSSGLPTDQFCGFRIGSAFRVDSHSCYKDKAKKTYTRQFSCETTKPLDPSSEYTLSADYYNAVVTINGTVQTLTASPATDKIVPSKSSDFTPGSILVLLASHTSSESAAASASTLEGIDNKATGDLYYFQLWSYDGTLAHNFMPAMRSDSAVGLYDTVTGKFYPASSGSLTGSAYGANERAGKKWTGAAGDGLMSTAANWENNDKPAEGDDVDFTIAVPSAPITADIDATFGKIYLGTGDLPAFTGSLTANGINDLTRIQAYDIKTDDFTFVIDKDLVWNGNSSANWGDAGAWLYDNVAADWENDVNAIFNNPGATATIAADASAASLAFNADATIAAGGGTLSVPLVSVASSVSATINAPTSGSLTKTGAGTLTLGSSRTDATTLSEGTLALSGTASLNWSNFTFGTDPAKPVVLDFGPTATLSSVPATWYIGNVANRTATVVKNGGDWTASTAVRIGSAAGIASFYHKGGTLTTGRIIVGDDNTTGHTGTGYCEISGGTVTCTGTDAPIIGCYSDGTVVVTNNGSLVCNSDIHVGYDKTTTGTLTVADGGSVNVAGGVVMCKDDRNVNASGILNIRTGGIVTANNVWRGFKAGSGTVNFDGGTFKKANGGNIFAASGNYEVDVTVSANGGTIDNNAFSVTLPCTITGAGGMTFVGSGTTTVSVNQSYLGTTTVADGTTLSVSGGVSFAGPVAFEAGSKLNIAGYDNAAAFVATSVTLPAEGTVSLTLNGGAFAEGVYAICSASGLTREDGSKFSFEMESGVAGFQWSVVNDMLVLTVGNVDPNAWTGLGGDGRMSNGANWCGGEVPAAGAGIDLSSISSDTTIIADAGRTFGTVTVGSGVITFTNELSATAFAAADGGPNPTAKISVAADSTVTLDGDLEFAANEETVYVCHSVAAGGVFAVTGDIIATPQQTTYVAACVTMSIDGTISARGLVSNGSLDEGFGLARGQQDSHVQWLIGDHGISGTTSFALGNRPNVAATITAAADFTVSAEIIQYRSLTFNTGGHTITLGAGTSEKSGGISGNVNKNQGVTGVTTIAGSGKVIVNYNVNDLTSDANPKANPFTVASGATLAFNPGADIGTGALKVKSGGTLEISSGTTTFDSLTVEDGAILGFNFTERKVAPALSVATSATLPSSVAVKVSAADGIRPKGGSYQLTSSNGAFTGATVSLAAGAPDWVKGVAVVDGEIVLEAKPVGFQLIVR